MLTGWTRQLTVRIGAARDGYESERILGFGLHIYGLGIIDGP